MAKTRKGNIRENKKSQIKKNPKSKIIETNSNRVTTRSKTVKNDVDHSSQKYTNSNEAETKNKQFDIELKLKKNKLTVRGQKVSIENRDNNFHLELRIKNNEIKCQSKENSKEVIEDQSESEKTESKSHRSLRERKAIIAIEDTKEVIRPLGNLQRSKTIAELANDAWKACKSQSKSQNITFEIDQYVMAKMKSFSPWAAKIIGFIKNHKKAYVYFYGTHNSGSVDVSDITLFKESQEVIRLQLLRHLDFFTKGIKEIEAELGITEEFSIINRRALNENKI